MCQVDIMRGILFIDDDEGVRRSITRALKHEPYEVFVCDSGEDGISFIRENGSDIATVISDYKMPGLDGLETLLSIGALNPAITRIILTGYATMEAAISAVNSGIDGFLTKPFDNRELKVKINEITVQKHLKQFVSEQIYQKIVSSSGILDPAVNEVSVLFSDIRNFTETIQNESPQNVANFLNDDYFTPMGEIAHAHNGTVDKHIGDGIMVLFGSPFGHEDDVQRAVNSAVSMQRAAAAISRRVNKERGFSLEIGIGISTGNVCSGILGSARKKEFTCVGLPVNIAARLQHMAKPGEILICERTYEKLSHSTGAEEMGPVSVKGVDHPICVYRIRPGQN